MTESAAPRAQHWRTIWLHPNAVRLTAALPDGTCPADPPWLQDVLLPGIPVEFRPAFSTSEFGNTLSVELIRGGQLALDSRQEKHGAVTIRFSGALEERFFGFGEWFNGFSRRSGHINLTCRESPALLQGRQTYSTIPFFISSRGYAAFLLNSYPARISFYPDRGLKARFVKGNADLILINAGDYKTLVDVYTQITGRPPLLPRWAFGLWVTSYPQENQQIVEASVRQHRQRKIPLDAVILDYHWEEKFHNFHWRPSLFPDPAGLLARLKSDGIKTGLIFTPFVNCRNDWIKKALLQVLVGNVTPGEFYRDERALDRYAFARDKGYFAHANASWWFGGGGMLDFTCPEACAWWNESLQPLYQQGVSFFKNDDGEYLPSDARTWNGMDGREAHNLYGFYYSRAIYEGMQSLDDRRALIYARSAWAGSQRYPALFLGDQKSSFGDMRRALRAGLNMSLAGFSYWTADTFGLDGKTTLETHMRGVQIGILSPVMRYFLRPPAVDATRFPWAYGEEAEENFKRHLSLRYRLLPYLNTLAWQAYLTGCPIARPMFLEFPGEPSLLDCDDQLMLGSALLAAPVLESGARTRTVRFPAGDWYDFWTGAHYQGPVVCEVPAPLDQLPLFVRGGYFLPLGSDLQFIPDGHKFDPLELHLWPPYSARFDFADEDGCTRAYQRAQASWCSYEIEKQPAGWNFRAQAAKAEILLQEPHRKVALILHGMKQPARVQPQPLVESAVYDPQNGQFTLQFTQPLQTNIAIPIQTEE